MSKRSEQARKLAHELSELTGVRVEVRHESGSEWYIEWGDGPTAEQMRARVASLLAEDRWPSGYGLMRDRHLSYFRNDTARAWAARAIAARRDGTWARKVPAGAAFRYRGVQRHGQRVVPQSELTPEDHAALSLVSQLIWETPYPGAASAPEDEPLIAELLEAGKRDQYRMVKILTNADRAPEVGPAPTLRVVRDDDTWCSGGAA